MADEITTMLPGEAEEDSELIDRVVQRIQEIHLQKGLEYYLELGQCLIDEMFGGNVAALAERGGKHKSFRALAQREDLPMSYVTLNAAVRVRQQFEALPAEVRGQLTMGHHKALLPLSGHDQERQQLARLATKQQWTVEKLKVEVRAVVARASEGETRGRKPLPKFEKTLNHFQRVLETEDAFADLEKIDDLDSERALELHNTLISLKMKCEELQQKIKYRVPGHK